MQLVQHYGQKLFARLWTAKRVRFVFENAELPGYARDLPAEGDVDNWALATLRTVQFQDLGEHANYDVGSIPGYTKDGFERIQNLRLTVAEAQFASQFNGVRSAAADREESAARREICASHAVPVHRPRDRRMLAGQCGGEAGAKRRVSASHPQRWHRGIVGSPLAAGMKRKILVVDIGGSNVKLLMSAKDQRKFPSGKSLGPRQFVSKLKENIDGWKFSAVSIGFPSPVRDGRILRDPKHLARGWAGFNFARALGNQRM